jgi:hypothetical protein
MRRLPWGDIVLLAIKMHKKVKGVSSLGGSTLMVTSSDKSKVLEVEE